MAVGLLSQQAGQQPVQLRIQFRVRDDVVQQPKFQRLGRGDRFAGESHFIQLAGRDQALQHGHDLHREDADLDLRHAEAGGVHADRHVAHAHQPHAARHRVAVHTSDQGEGEVAGLFHEFHEGQADF